jgi:alpha-galactosidase
MKEDQMKPRYKVSRLFMLTGALVVLAGAYGHAEVTSRSHGAEVTLQNQLVTVEYHTQTGKMDVVWQDGHKLLNLESGAELANRQRLATSAYSIHSLENTPDSGKSSSSHEYTIRNTSPGKPDLLQRVWLYDDMPWIAIEAELAPQASAIGTRHFDAVMLKGGNPVQMTPDAALRVLHVPFDNDMWFRYKSEPVAGLKADETYSSEEVTCIYDNVSREAIVIGSITHNIWKTAIDVRAAGGAINDLDVYGGISSPTGVRTDTHDTVPHGLVRGGKVISPRIFIGSFADWRDGLETYGKVNAALHPPLVWPAGVPMGWNSWAAYAGKINDHRYLGAAAFVRDALIPQGFGRDNVVYINLDAFWSNLDAVQLTAAVASIKSMHGADGTRFEPGIYWTPFAYWSDDVDAWVEGTGMKYRYRDILLKAPDGSLLPKVDGGRAIDPSHPGTKERTRYFLKQFQQMGFHYLKLDFLSHGSLEGSHYDPAIQTGIQAYSVGMQQIVDETANRMFLSLSIAPLFPSGYGHARRISCDTKGHISGSDQSTEYMLNSLTYGWWTSKNLYITDPDHVVLGENADQGARTVTEGRSRLLSAIISGGMILDSSRLADDPEGQELARAVYDNRNLFAVGSEGRAFHPVEGDTGDKAAAAFTRRAADGVYLAVFNYDEKQPRTISVPLSRIDQQLAAAPSIAVTDVATREALAPARGAVTVELSPAESKLLKLSQQP